jgi:PIN like domain
LKFLVDNNLPPALARALNELSAGADVHVEKVVALREKFPANTADEKWMSVLAEDGGWNIVSGDNFRKTSVERELLRRAGFNVFVLQKSWSSQQYWQKSAQLVLWWPRIIDYASKSERAAVRVPWRVSGKFEQIQLK